MCLDNFLESDALGTTHTCFPMSRQKDHSMSVIKTMTTRLKFCLPLRKLCSEMTPTLN